MKTIHYNLLMVLAILAFGLTACEDDDDKEQQTTATEVTIDASDWENWVYFSFETGAVVRTSAVTPDADTHNDWDIAFHLWDVRTNSGASGPGTAGAYDANTTDFDAVTSASVSFTSDETGTVYTGMPPTGQNTMTVGLSSVLAGFLNIDLATQPPLMELTNKVFIVKTIDGKYVKMQVTDFWNDSGAYGHIKLKYENNGATE